MTELRVLVSGHARERAQERLGIGVNLVALEVACAVAEGRCAVNQPRWAVDRGDRVRADRTRAGRPRGGHVRWLWSADLQRAYLAKRERGRWIVITAVAAAALPVAA